MNVSVTYPPLKRYTFLAGTLCKGPGRLQYDQIDITIKPDNRPPITRVLHKYETRDYSDRPVDSERWADCLIKAGFRRRQYLVSPWTVCTDKGWSNIEDVAVIAAIDGSGKWMLAPQTKEERRALAEKRDKDNRARRDLLNKRGQEAEVMMASLATQPKSARPRAASSQFSTASASQRSTATSSDLARRAGPNGKIRRPSVQY